MFSLRNKENYLCTILIIPSYLELCILFRFGNTCIRFWYIVKILTVEKAKVDTVPFLKMEISVLQCSVLKMQMKR